MCCSCAEDVQHITERFNIQPDTTLDAQFNQLTIKADEKPDTEEDEVFIPRGIDKRVKPNNNYQPYPTQVTVTVVLQNQKTHLSLFKPIILH